ncbi:hypothetical protein EYC80_002591 [Monilinia laxa]|uniref:Uncharacterized protein n=1 Tax=Monilinia laxa TaxID=61186 RepID=A0A5N6K4E1_MONLA|nr:hypothetical protein EYC80_002591 [Monilinia laxa]
MAQLEREEKELSIGKEACPTHEESLSILMNDLYHCMMTLLSTQENFAWKKHFFLLYFFRLGLFILMECMHSVQVGGQFAVLYFSL